MEPPRLIAWRSSDRHFLLPVAILVAVLAALVTLLYVVHDVRKIDGPSMEPTFLQADRILVTRGYDVPEVGDIVSFTTVDRNGTPVRLIKRVIALPGDQVEIIGDSAYVNGELSVAAPRAFVGTAAYRLGPMTVPDGNVYVLGDNRPVSLDSRYLGFIPVSSIAGEAVAVIFPPGRMGGIDE
ncbi:MAG: signal peptidase I [Coriobacteriia bacterium]|nr:signal peptidase I [Coriobacteriia bacterium]